MHMKTEILKYNLHDRGRKHTGQDRSNVDVSAMIQRINSPDTQELVSTGGLLGYYGHQIRQRFGMMPPETAMIDGKKIHLEPAFKTVLLKAHPDGTVEHQAEFLNNETGQFVANQYKAKVGGFSTAVSYVQNGLKLIPKLFAGFDFVFQPNFATNIGNGVLLDGLFCNDETALFDSIENDAAQAQLAQVLELSIVQSYDNIHAQMALMQQNEQAMDVIQRDIDRQSKYAEIKAKQMQDKFDACTGETRSFDAVLNDANSFLSADLNKLEQKADDNMPKLSKMRMWF